MTNFDFTFGFNPFFLEQLEQMLPYYPSPFRLEEFKREVEDNFKFSVIGYRDGVLKVPIQPGGYKSRVLVLEDGMKIEGQYAPRVQGETPRRQSGVRVQSVDFLPKAKLVEVVLYSRETLEEKDEPRSGADWDIITILAHPTEESGPMNPQTLMANHFGASGGTSTKMSPLEFEQALKSSYLYWSNKAMALVG